MYNKLEDKMKLISVQQFQRNQVVTWYRKIVLSGMKANGSCCWQEDKTLHLQGTQKKGHRVIGLCKYGAIMFATSCFIVCRTHCSVRLICDKLSGRQLASKSGRCQLDKDESDAMEGKAVFNSACNLWKFTLLGRDGRNVISSICNLWKSSLLGIWDKWCTLARSTTFGSFVTVYIVRQRKMKNPTKCVQTLSVSLWIVNMLRRTCLRGHSDL